MKIIKLTSRNFSDIIGETIAILKSGGLVVFPSDTVYGLAADAQNPVAVSKLLNFKERKPGQAISVFVADEKMTKDYVILNQNAKNIIKNLLPGPFTIVCFSRHQVDRRLEAENGTLGFRIPDYPPINHLIKLLGHPITATAANLSGTPPHYSISSLLKSISEKKKQMLDLIVNAGTLPKNKPSTVIDATAGELKTLRLGDFFPKTASSLISKSEKETLDLGRFLAAKFIKKFSGRAIVFLLQGELGTGKTVLAKGIGKALKIKKEIVSPTYNLCYEYDITLYPKETTDLFCFDIENLNQTIRKEYNKQSKFIHYDLYRIGSPEELKEIKFLENLSCGNIYAVEWPERIPRETISALKNHAEIIFITLKHLAENEREIKWTILF